MENGFMSQMKECKRLTLDDKDRSFLGLMCLAGDKTTRPKQVSMWFGHGLSAWTMERILGGTLTYKNVRKRMIKFRRLGLIEVIKEDKPYRNAIKYKPTTLGLFQGILNDPTSIIPELNKNNVLFQTMIYRFFEPKSIEKFHEYYCMSHLFRYVKGCCELILDAIEKSSRRKGRSLSLSDSYIDDLVENEVKNFIFTIVTTSNIVVEDPDTPNIKSIFPIETLKEDKKFMGILHQMKNDFDSGYQKFKPAIG